MRTATRLFGLFLIMTLLGIAGCGESEIDDSVPDAGLPNPASVFCEDNGGTVDILADEDGNESGVCRLPDGTEIDEWEYYRQSHEGGGTGLANPAATFCEEQGGVTSGVEPMCELPDGSVVDAWELYREAVDSR